MQVIGSLSHTISKDINNIAKKKKKKTKKNNQQIIS